MRERRRVREREGMELTKSGKLSFSLSLPDCSIRAGGPLRCPERQLLPTSCESTSNQHSYDRN